MTPPPWANKPTDHQQQQPPVRRTSHPQTVTMSAQGIINNGNIDKNEPTVPSPGLRIASANTFQRQPSASDKRTKSGKFTLDQLRATDGLVPLQSGTNQFDSQAGKTGFGMPRNTSTNVVFSDDGEQRHQQRFSMEQLRASDGIVRLQSGTNQFASQKLMTGFGTPRDVKGKHLKRIWELEFPEEVDIYDDHQQQQQH